MTSLEDAIQKASKTGEPAVLLSMTIQERTIQSEWLVDLLDANDDVSPRGLTIVGGVFSSLLDLSCGSYPPLRLRNCVLRHGITATDAKLDSFELDTCRTGPLLLNNAAIDGDLTLNGSMIMPEDHPSLLFGQEVAAPALEGSHLQVRGSIYALNTVALGWGAMGTIRLSRARIEGALDFGGATIVNAGGAENLDEGVYNLCRNQWSDLSPIENFLYAQASGPAFIADGVYVGDSFLLPRVRMHNASKTKGCLQILDGQIRHELVSKQCSMINEKGISVLLQRTDLGSLTFGGDNKGNQTSNIRGCSRDLATITCNSIKIDGDMHFENIEVANSEGSAITLEQADIRGRATFASDVIIIGVGLNGGIYAQRARIGGLFGFHGGRITVFGGPCVSADHIRIGILELRGELASLNNEWVPCVSFMGAEVSADATFGRGVVQGGCTGVLLDGADIAGRLKFDFYQQCAGDGRVGSLSLRGASVSFLEFGSEFRLWTTSHTAIDCNRLRVRNDFKFEGIATSSSGGPLLSLDGATVGNSLTLNIECLTQKSGDVRMSCNGLTYGDMPRVLHRSWLATLNRHTERYASQPFVQFAAMLGRHGEEALQRQALIDGRHSHLSRERASLDWNQRAWGTISGAVIGFGYRSSRALYFALGVVLTSLVLLVMANWQGLLITNHGDHCSFQSTVEVGLQKFLPIFGYTSAASHCHYAPNMQGDLFFVVQISLAVIAWIFISLFIAGFANLVKRV